MKRIFTIFAMAALLLTGCEKETPEPIAVKVSQIKLVGMPTEFTVGRSVTISAVITPDDATYKRVTFTSSNPEVATVECIQSENNYSLALLKAVGPGKATITATANDGSGVKAEAEVDVLPATKKVSDISITMSKSEVKVGDMVPQFDLHLLDGTKVPVSSLKGKVVMLQFTASWCGVCRKEMPFIESDIWQKHKGNKNFALFGIDRDEPIETVKAFAEKTGVTYPLALDPGADHFAKYADRKAGITRNVLVDKTGKIVMLTRLYNEEEFASLCKKIDELLAQ